MLIQIQEENENLRELIAHTRHEKGLPVEQESEAADHISQEELDRLE